MLANVRAICAALILAGTVATAALSMTVTIEATGPTTIHAGDSVPLRITMAPDGSEPAGYGAFAWSMLAHIDEGLRSLLSPLPDMCHEAHAKACCNYCNGFEIRGDPRPDFGPRIFQYGYAGTACSGVCGGGSCAGTREKRIIGEFSVGMDPAYQWPGPGQYQRTITLRNLGLPVDNNIWSCCGGQSGIACNACVGQCHAMGFTVGADSAVTITVIH